MFHRKISHRLLGCFALITALLIALSTYSVFVTQGIDSKLTANSSQNAVIQRAAIDFRGSVHDRAIALRDAVIAPDPTAVHHELQQIERLAQAHDACFFKVDQAVDAGQPLHILGLGLRL